MNDKLSDPPSYICNIQPIPAYYELYPVLMGLALPILFVIGWTSSSRFIRVATEARELTNKNDYILWVVMGILLFLANQMLMWAFMESLAEGVTFANLFLWAGTLFCAVKFFNGLRIVGARLIPFAAALLFLNTLAACRNLPMFNQPRIGPVNFGAEITIIWIGIMTAIALFTLAMQHIKNKQIANARKDPLNPAEAHGTS